MSDLLDVISDGWVTTIKLPDRAPDYAYTDNGYRSYRFWFAEMLLAVTENGWIGYKMTRLSIVDNNKISNLRAPVPMKEEVQKAFQDYLDKVILGQ